MIVLIIGRILVFIYLLMLGMFASQALANFLFKPQCRNLKFIGRCFLLLIWPLAAMNAEGQKKITNLTNPEEDVA